MIEKKYVKVHRVISRECQKEDTDRILVEGEVVLEISHRPPEGHPKGIAVAHSQITSVDPLRFFVTYEGELIINPVITRHTKHTVKRVEGCTTFLENVDPVVVDRWNKCEVEYWTIEDPVTAEWVKKIESLKGIRSQIFQHEIDHMDGKYVFDELVKKLEQEQINQ